jgi:hypothetical protein
MPNRILKESICTSETIDKLTNFQEIFFYRLIVCCDDYGRLDARPKMLAAKLFPLKDMRLKQIEDALRALSSVELVTLYQVDGKPFLQMNTWDKHQRLRLSKHKYPGMEEMDSAASCGDSRQVAANCGEFPQTAASCGLTRAREESQSESQSQSEVESESHARAREEHTDFDFDVFWSAYPRHEDKQAARKAFDKIHPDEQLMQKMIAAIAAWKESDQWLENGGQFIPYPSTWLNKRRWEDEVPAKPVVQKKPAKTVIAQQYNQRDYSSVNAYYSSEQDREMEEFMRREDNGS